MVTICKGVVAGSLWSWTLADPRYPGLCKYGTAADEFANCWSVLWAKMWYILIYSRLMNGRRRTRIVAKHFGHRAVDGLLPALIFWRKGDSNLRRDPVIDLKRLWLARLEVWCQRCRGSV